MFLLILFIVVQLNVASSLYITSPPSQQGHLTTPYYRFLGQQPPFNVTGQLVIDPHNIFLCTPDISVDLKGKIAFAAGGNRILFSILIQRILSSICKS